MKCLTALCLVLATAVARADDAHFCIATCEGHQACFDETSSYRYLVNTVRHRVHVVIVSTTVCRGVDVETGATYHLVNAVHVNGWNIAGVGWAAYDQVNKLLLVGDQGDVLVLHQTLRLTRDGPVVIDTQMHCDAPE